MTHELIIKKSEGGTLRIKVTLVTFGSFQTDFLGNPFRYDVIQFYKAKGKRKEELSKIATDAEIFAAKMELWNKLKP